jgi:hypothetical protein
LLFWTLRLSLISLMWLKLCFKLMTFSRLWILTSWSISWVLASLALTYHLRRKCRCWQYSWGNPIKLYCQRVKCSYFLLFVKLTSL